MSLLLVLAACSDGLDNIEYNSDSGITVAAPEVTETTGTSLTLTASATGNVGDIVRRGFCYSANAQTPTISDNVVDADENFSASISGLMGSTTYYVRAFVYGNSRYTYSDPVEATTGAMSLDEQLANYVAPAYPDDYSSIADWTNRNAEIAEVLAQFGRSGVPLYLIYRPDGRIDVLPELLTAEIVLEAVRAP